MVIHQSQLREIKIKGYAQGTTYAVNYFATDSLVTKGQIDSILKVIDLSMSLYQSNSTINKFNQSENGLAIDEHFAAVVKRAFEINKDTQGLFDVTVAPLVQLWGFGPKKINVFPDSATIEKVLPCIGMDKIEIKNSFLYKHKPCVNIDLNGIAQGYSVDVLANFLLQKGIKIFIVEVGGELRASGPKPDGTEMKIGIEGPNEGQAAGNSIKHVITFKQGAVTTSGNYQKYLKIGNQTVSHLINPKTGYPLTNEMISVTVFANDAITADGYDNALMAMDLTEALNFVTARKNLAAYFIYKKPDGKIADTLSNGFKQLMMDTK
ncbi:thiamine biosynthesis protein ApbE [Pedobacter sp. Hv1]|nr:thiamine biosynthesis protein ApbE [Pedobacter sp. Hv1]